VAVISKFVTGSSQHSENNGMTNDNYNISSSKNTITIIVLGTNTTVRLHLG